jgi:hypothetical protein
MENWKERRQGDRTEHMKQGIRRKEVKKEREKCGKLEGKKKRGQNGAYEARNTQKGSKEKKKKNVEIWKERRQGDRTEHMKQGIHLIGDVRTTGEIWSMTISHPDSSSRHTYLYKPTVMTYGHILHKHTTNVHQRNPI